MDFSGNKTDRFQISFILPFFTSFRFSPQETKTYFIFDNFKVQTFLVAHFIVIILLSLFRLVMAKNVNIPIIRSITPL